MPFWEQDELKLHYEESGSGFPVLLFAPGGMHSAIGVWGRMPWNPIEVLSDHFRVIAMDQRNAGESRGPIGGEAGWRPYAAAHVALLDETAGGSLRLTGRGRELADTVCAEFV